MPANKVSKLDKELRKLIRSLIDEGFELGVQTAIYLDGKQVIDISEGLFSPKSKRKVEPDTIFHVCSTGKGVVATLAHILASKGLLDYERTVASYWPEYGVNGKESTTVRQALAHQAGIPQTPPFSGFKEFCDWEIACRRTAEAVLEWTPGSKAAYHPISFGWLIGGLMERAAGRSFSELFHDEIVAPLGIEDEMFFGVPEKALKRASHFVPQPVQQEQITTAPDTQRNNAAVNAWMPPIMDLVNNPDVTAACAPAANGMMSARAIARFYASLMGEVDGVRLLSDKALDKALVLQTAPGSLPECFGHGIGLGYILKGTKATPGSFFGHGGAGGSEGMANRRQRLAIGITKNRMDTHFKAPGHTNRLIIQTVNKIMGDEGDGGFYIDKA